MKYLSVLLIILLFEVSCNEANNTTIFQTSPVNQCSAICKQQHKIVREVKESHSHHLEYCGCGYE